MSESPETLKAQERDSWNSEACGERYGEEQEVMRYRLEPEILEFADFKSIAGKRVLEVGVGMGTDFLNFVRAGAIATGVDFTERAVAITRQRLEAEGLSAELRIADAEHLPFQEARSILCTRGESCTTHPTRPKPCANCSGYWLPAEDSRSCFITASPGWLLRCGLDSACLGAGF